MASLLDMSKSNPNQRWLICAILAAFTLGLYLQVAAHEFVSYDDDVYVTNNPQIQTGLSGENIVWAFTSTSAANWHPITWLSHMLDCQFYGLKPSGHHFTNLLIHLSNVLLLFWVLQVMTGALWRSALVAALFALHPLNVESVAWIAERKNLLSTFFWILTLGAYVWYARKPELRRYLVVLALFALGLMSKPMVVTLPFVLLLLDYWPLERLKLRPTEPDRDNAPAKQGKRPAKKTKQSEVTRHYPRQTAGRLIIEKVPLLMLAAASSIITVIAQKKGGAVGAVETFPISVRLTNAVVSYAGYLGQMIWPSGLSVLYPHPKGTLPAWEIGLSALALLCITALVAWQARHYRWAAVGWLWYLGTLVPVIGLVQVGLQARADRYAYVPLIGVFVAIVWAAAQYAGNVTSRRRWLIGVSISLLACLAIAANLQLQHWRNSLALFEHAVDVTDNNYVAHNNLGELLAGGGRLEEAASHFNRALEINPQFDQALHNSGMMLVQQHKPQEAIEQFSKAVEINPNFLEAYNKLGAALAETGRLDEAAAALSRALEINPRHPSAHANMALVLERQGKLDEAVTHYSEALRSMVNAAMMAQTHYRLGNLLARRGDKEQAVAHYREALRLKPDFTQAQTALDNILENPASPQGVPRQ